MASFNGFTDAQMDRISQKLGYSGPKHKFGEFLASNPAANRAYSGLLNKVNMKFNRGGVVKMQAGGYTPEQIREYTKGMSDKQIAEAANKYNVSAGDLAKAFNTTTDVINTRAGQAGVNLTNAAPRMVSGNEIESAGGIDSFREQLNVPPPAPSMSVDQGPSSPIVGGGGSDTLRSSFPLVGGSGTSGESATIDSGMGGISAGTDTSATIPAGTIAPLTTSLGQTIQAPPAGSEQVTPELIQSYVNQVYAANPGDYFGATAKINEDLAKFNQAGYNINFDDVSKAVQSYTNAQTDATEAALTPPPATTTTTTTEATVTGADAAGGTGVSTDTGTGTATPAGTGTIQDTMIQRAMQPALPEGGKMVAEGIGFDQATQQIGTGTGQVGVAPSVATPTVSPVAQATGPSSMTAQTVGAATAAGQLQQTTAAVGAVSAPMMAQTMPPTDTQVAQQQAAQIDQAVRVQAPQARQLSAEELVSAPANAQAAATFAEQVQAAQAQPTPEATVQGQLVNLMADFEGGQTPAWAAGAMRNATAIMAQRGLGASSMAGQAIIQAAMESALPIATQDAQTMSQFELTNLSNRQQRAMLAAQQRAQFIGQEFDQEFQARVQNASRISDIANMNFNAEQQIALENARMAQTVDLNNLTNRQAVQMANIAQIAQLEMTNLNNRQQAAVQNAQSFLQMDLTNLSNEQQATMFDAQSRVQTLLSDTAAENAARQFNATSENQTNQFFSNLSAQVSQFNATQNNAMEQFNVEQGIAVKKFNAEIQNQRDQFNAQNQVVIAQSNAQWRRDIATADTAALNEANAFNAQAVLGISEQAYANLWQAYEDEMEYAWQGGQNELDRINKLAQQRLLADAELSAADAAADASTSSALGSFAATALFGTGGSAGFLTKFM